MSEEQKQAVEIIDLSSQSVTVASKLKTGLATFESLEPVLDEEAEKLKAISEITGQEEREKARLAAAAANKKIKEYGDLRKDVTRVLDGLTKTIIDHERTMISGLSIEINRIKQLITEFDLEEKRRELERLAQIEKERKEREKALRKEEERVKAIRDAIDVLRSKKMEALRVSTDLQRMRDFWAFLTNLVDLDQFEEYKPEAEKLKAEYLEWVNGQIENLEKMAAIEEEAKKAEQDNMIQAAKLEQVKKEQEEARMKAKAEEDRIKMEMEKAQADAQRQRDKEEAERREQERREEEEAKLRELTGAKGKYQVKDWDIEITDPKAVPIECLIIKPKLSEIKKRLKRGEQVPGIKATPKQSVKL